MTCMTCMCGHDSEEHQSDPSGMAGSPCWHGDGLDGLGHPLNRCGCEDFSPAGCADAR